MLLSHRAGEPDQHRPPRRRRQGLARPARQPTTSSRCASPTTARAVRSTRAPASTACASGRCWSNAAPDDHLARGRGHRGAAGHPRPAERDVMMLAQPARILLADDHALVRSGLRMILDAEPDLQVVAEAADGHEALAALDDHPVGPGHPRHRHAADDRSAGRPGDHPRAPARAHPDPVDVRQRAVLLRGAEGGRVAATCSSRSPTATCSRRAGRRCAASRSSTPGAVTALIRDYLHRARQGDALPDTILTPREEEVLKLDRRGVLVARDRRPRWASAPRRSTGTGRTCWPSSACATGWR